jgi:fatty acid desaturase
MSDSSVELGDNADLRALRAEIRARGLDDPPAARVLAVWAFDVALASGGIWATLASPSLAVRAAGLLATVLGMVSMATIAHTASHNALSDRRLLNRLVFYATYPLYLGLSARYWHHSHVVVHHPGANIVDLDDDCDLRPAFALNEQHQRSGGPLMRALWRAQPVTLLLLLPFNGFNIQRQGWRRLGHELASRQRRSSAAFADLALLVAHYVLSLALPMAIFPWRAVVAAYVARCVLTGMALFAVLAPGHFPAEAACLDRSQRDRGDFYLRQTVSTVNFTTGPIGHWLCSGLEYQIEHHLFPSVSHAHLAALSPLVREFCARRGLPYRSMSWPMAVWKSYLAFVHPKPVHDDVEALRLPVTGPASAPSRPPALDEPSEAVAPAE